MKSENNVPNEILVNKIFAGSYLNEGNNIGHEVINLFRDDLGDNYLYITPGGTVKGHAVQSVIFVRNLKGKTAVEVVAKAEGLSPVSPNVAAQIKYAGVPLGVIFGENVYNGTKEGSDVANVAYRAENVRLPKGDRRLVLTIEKDFTVPGTETIYLPSRELAIDNQSSRKYYSLAKDPQAYLKLQEFIADSDFWESENTTRPLELNPDIENISSGPTFLEIIRKENDELVFSNLLDYYFRSSREGFREFARTVLDIPDFGVEFKSLRERDNIDLWVESENYIIVIENKIKSGINGWKNTNKSQLDTYYQTAQKRVRNRQDSAYGKNIRCFVFTPDYNLLKPNNPDYLLITYRKLHQFFATHRNFYDQEQYFNDFLHDLEKHTKTLSEFNFNVMRTRFEAQIRQSLLTK